MKGVTLDEFIDLNYDLLEEEYKVEHMDDDIDFSYDDLDNYIYEKWVAYTKSQDDIRYDQYKDDKLTGDLP